MRFVFRRPLQRVLFRPPIFAIFIVLCVWASYDVVLPLVSTRLWKACIFSHHQDSFKCLERVTRQGQSVLPSMFLESIVQGYNSESDDAARMSGHNQLPTMGQEDSLLVVHATVDDNGHRDSEDARKLSLLQPPLKQTAGLLAFGDEEESTGPTSREQHLDADLPDIVATKDEYSRPVIAPGSPTMVQIVTTPENKPNMQPESEASEEEVAKEEVVKLMEGFRRSADVRNTSFISNNSSCDGRRVFAYSLPSKFNEDLLKQCDGMVPWQNMCDYLVNSGMGKLVDAYVSHSSSKDVLVPPEAWYQTHQYMLEIIFHERLKHYSCIVPNPELADMFYIPYYGGLDVLRWHFVENVSNVQRDALGLELIRWLERQPTWMRNQGVDHVLVLGKISWDFRRWPTGDGWGSSLLLQHEMQNVTKLLIERHPWHEHDIGVPHPTFFHPHHDKDIRIWQAHIERAKRRHFVSFAGEPRLHQPESIRSHLIQQCLGSTDGSCFFLHCGNHTCLQPSTTMDLFLHSEFCLQPPGDSPTRRSIFDSLIGGCIPVLFDPYSAYYQYPWHLPANGSLYSVYFPAKDVIKGKVNVIHELKRIPKIERHAKRRRIIHDILPGLVYAMPGANLTDVDDAFIISLKSLLSMVSSRLEKELGKD